MLKCPDGSRAFSRASRSVFALRRLLWAKIVAKAAETTKRPEMEAADTALVLMVHVVTRAHASSISSIVALASTHQP